MAKKPTAKHNDKLYGLIILGGLLVLLWPLVFGGGCAGEQHTPKRYETPARQVEVLAADRVRIEGQSYRLAGVAEPQPCRREQARLMLRRRIDRAGELTWQQADARWGQDTIHGWANRTTLSLWLVGQGLAEARPHGKGRLAQRLRAGERRARNNNEGTWGPCSTT